VTCFEDAEKADREKFGRWHRGMLERGVYLAPSAYEARPCPGEALLSRLVTCSDPGQHSPARHALHTCTGVSTPALTGAPHPHNNITCTTMCCCSICAFISPALLSCQQQGYCSVHDVFACAHTKLLLALECISGGAVPRRPVACRRASRPWHTRRRTWTALSRLQRRCLRSCRPASAQAQGNRRAARRSKLSRLVSALLRTHEATPRDAPVPMHGNCHLGRCALVCPQQE